jgi:hypothetical protein
MREELLSIVLFLATYADHFSQPQLRALVQRAIIGNQEEFHRGTRMATMPFHHHRGETIIGSPILVLATPALVAAPSHQRLRVTLTAYQLARQATPSTLQMLLNVIETCEKCIMTPLKMGIEVVDVVFLTKDAGTGVMTTGLGSNGMSFTGDIMVRVIDQDTETVTVHGLQTALAPIRLCRIETTMVGTRTCLADRIL